MTTPTRVDIAVYCRNAADIFGTDEADRQRELHGFAHWEDAEPDHIVWARGGTWDDYAQCNAGALILDATAHPPWWPNKLAERGLCNFVLAANNPRGLIRSLIIRWFADRKMRGRVASAWTHPSVSLGADGQAYDWDGSKWVPFPQIGGFRIGAGVDIGPSCTIQRGCIGDTVIGDGCKIGNGVNIGHDTRIGAHTLISAGATLAGWVRVGERCKIWMGAMIKNGVRIGDAATIGMGAVVLEDVPAGETWVGNPARSVQCR